MKIIYIIILALSLIRESGQEGNNTTDLAEKIIEEVIAEGNLATLLEVRHEEIPLDKWVGEGKIVFNENEKDILQITRDATYASLINIDEDDDMELYLLLREGSMGNPRVLIYDKDQDDYRLKYEYADYKDGRKIYPFNIEGQVFFVSMDTDFETKLVNAITVYDFEEWHFTNYKRYVLDYNYESLKGVAPLTAYIGEEFLSTLTDFESIPTGRIEVRDPLYDRSFIFNIQVHYTSVWYEPNKVLISSPETLEPKIKGFSQLLTSREGEGCLNMKFFIDGENNLHLVKICYPRYTGKEKLGELIIRDYIFGDEVKEVLSQVIYPSIEVKDIKSGSLR